MDGTTKKPGQRMFICFFIVRHHGGGSFQREWTYPVDGCSDAEFKQYENFFFPLSQTGRVLDLRNQHFTYMLTDIDTSRKYGFCKIIDSGNGKLCYCFLSDLPWFEIFYKCLNCVCTVHIRDDTNTLHSIVEKLYLLSVPRPNEIVSLSTSLTFSVPDDSVLPSIPETRNMMEYVSTISTRNMIDIYAAYMFERRIIFTSSNLSVISGCVFASESLLHPLSWQHIFIPLLHEHIIDYCAAPMPFIIGMHSSLYKKVEGTATTEGVVLVDIDENTVSSPYDDVHKLPNEAISYLRSQLGKPNISVGSNLAQAFLKTQAQLFGGYRAALKFRMGETILFDEDKFISSFKSGGKRSFAEELVHMQAFHQFIDKRLHMLNNGIGFHDSFEEVVTILQQEYDYSSVYTEWIARKRSEIYHQAKANMKQARSSAKQSMREMKSALKSTPKESTKENVIKELSLSEDITTARPPRPPRPPPPTKPPRTVRRFTVIDQENHDQPAKSPSPVLSPNSRVSPSNERLLIDFSSYSSSCQPPDANGVLQHHNVPLPVKPNSPGDMCCNEKLLTGRCPHTTATVQRNDRATSLTSESSASSSSRSSSTNQCMDGALIQFD